VEHNDAGWWAATGCRRARQHGAMLTRGPDSTVLGSVNSNGIQTILNRFKFALYFDWSKRYLLLLEKFQIKYGWKEIEIRNNLPYRIFSRFEMEFEWKFMEFSMHWNWRKFTEKSWKFGFTQNLPSKLLVTPYCKKKKSISIKRGSKIWIPLKKGNWIDFAIVGIINFIFEFLLLI
jgi:hypothetical protein